MSSPCSTAMYETTVMDYTGYVDGPLLEGGDSATAVEEEKFLHRLTGRLGKHRRITDMTGRRLEIYGKACGKRETHNTWTFDVTAWMNEVYT